MSYRKQRSVHPAPACPSVDYVVDTLEAKVVFWDWDWVIAKELSRSEALVTLEIAVARNTEHCVFDRLRAQHLMSILVSEILL